MAVPRVTCSANIENDFSGSAQLIALGATATESPTSYQWTMLDVPVGSTANSGANEDFFDGVSTVQNPSFYVDASISGAYVLQCIATNGEGSSDPNVDRENGQQIVYVKTEHRGLKIPNDWQYNWSNDLNVTLNALINTKLDEAEEPDAGTTLDASTSKHGLCPALSGNAAHYLDGAGNFTEPSDVVPSVHGDSHKSSGSDATPDATSVASGLCPTLSNVATQFLDGEGNWTVPPGTAHNTEHITGGSDIIPAPTTTKTGACPALPSSGATTKFLRGDATWTVPSSLGNHATDHIDSGSDPVPVATAANTGLVPVRSGAATDYMDATGNWSVPPSSDSLDGAYNGGAAITVDALPVTLNRTQTADDQPSQKINHDYDGNQGTGIEFVGSASTDIPNGETASGISLSIPKPNFTSDLWYAAGGTASLVKKTGSDWVHVLHETSATLITDIKGFAPDDIYACGQRDDEGTTRAFLAHYDGARWIEDTAFYAIMSGDDAIVRFIIPESPTEIYVIVTISDNLYTYLCDGAGNWTNKGPNAFAANVETACQAVKLGNGILIAHCNGFHYTEDITASTPTWAPDVWSVGLHGACIDTNASPDRVWIAYRTATNQIQFHYNTSITNTGWTAGPIYTHTEEIALATYSQRHYHAMWADDSGNMFLTIESSASDHGLVRDIDTTPVFTSTTDKVYAIYGLSATDVRMGSDKDGYIKTWNGSVISEKATGVYVENKAIWGKTSASFSTLWYAVGGTKIAKKANGSWSEVSHGLSVIEIYDIKGFAADDIWICGQTSNGANGKSFVAHYDGVSWTMDTGFDALVGSDDYGLASSILTVSPEEFYVLHTTSDVYDHNVISYTAANGWVNKGRHNTGGGPQYDMFKDGNRLSVDLYQRHGYTDDIYADTPVWTASVYAGTDKAHCTIYDPVLDNYVTALRLNGSSEIQFRAPNPPKEMDNNWGTIVGTYDSGSGGYGETNGYASHMTWHDGLGKIFHNANHTGSNHVFIHSIETGTPVGVATTEKVYGMYGLSAANIKIGTDKTGFLKAWDGSTLSDEDTGVSANFRQTWGIVDSPGTSRVEGCKVEFTGTGPNETSALRIGAGATHAIKADSGVITLGKMDDPIHVPDSGTLFTKEVSSKVEAHYRDDQANIVQLTNGEGIAYGDVALIYSNDTESSTTNSSYFQIGNFTTAMDSDRLPVRYEVIVSLWQVGGSGATFKVQIGTVTPDIVEIYSSATGETVSKGTITLAYPEEDIYYCTLYLMASGGGTAYKKYVAIYAVYEAL